MLWDFEDQILDMEKLSGTVSVGFLEVKMKVLFEQELKEEWMNR